MTGDDWIIPSRDGYQPASIYLGANVHFIKSVNVCQHKQVKENIMFYRLTSSLSMT